MQLLHWDLVLVQSVTAHAIICVQGDACVLGGESRLGRGLNHRNITIGVDADVVKVGADVATGVVGSDLQLVYVLAVVS